MDFLSVVKIRKVEMLIGKVAVKEFKRIGIGIE